MSIPGRGRQQGGLKFDRATPERADDRTGRSLSGISARWNPVRLLLPIFGLLTSVLPLPSAAESPKVSAVRIEGARELTARELAGGMETVVGAGMDSLAVERDLRRILARYLKAGFYLTEAGFSATPTQEGRVKVTFRLREGPRAVVGRVQVTGADATGLPGEVWTRPGRPFRVATLEADVEGIIRRYENGGYPFCAVRPTLGRPDATGRMDVTLRVDAGPFVRIGALRVSGNRTTRPWVIGRLMGLKPGQGYDQRRVDRGRKTLLRSGLFDVVSEPTVGPQAPTGEADLSVQVLERKANRVEGAMGFVPGGDGGRGYLAGRLDLGLRNLAGTGRGVWLQWERKGPSASDAGLRYEEPWLGPTPLGGWFHLHLNQRPGYAETEVGSGVDYDVADGVSTRIEGTWVRVTPDSSGLNYAPASRSWRVRFGLSRDGRDDPDNPRRGSRAEAAGTVARSRAAKEGTIVRWGFEATAERSIPLHRSSVLVVAVHAKGVRSEEKVLPLYEKVRLGGAATLRGYEEEQFAGRNAAWGTIEYRLLTGRRSRVFLFLDAATLEGRPGDRPGVRSRRLQRTGYGAGLRAESRVGVVGLDLGVGQDGGVSRTKVHVRMAHAF